MKVCFFKLVSTLSLIAIFQVSAIAKPRVIYGDDNRKDLYEVTNPLYLKLAKSTAAMIPAESLSPDRDGVLKLKASTLASRGICKEERFSNQLAGAHCSGFLVAPDILVTAGHCITDATDCNNNAWVFDFNVTSPNFEGPSSIQKKNVYRCSEILERRLEQSNMDDYAVIRLDRAVSDRDPLSFRREGSINVGEEILVIGHPTGLPTKVADGANVRTNDQDRFFVTNLDTYGGNSGSAVFNASTGLVEGVLVRGEQDYEYDMSKFCRASKHCENNSCRGEDVTRITNIQVLKQIQ